MRALLRSTRVADLSVLVLIAGTVAGHSDTVRDHMKSYYGRVQSVGPQGVMLLNGCSGDDLRMITLTNLEEVDLGAPCSPPRLTSISSPSTAACNGPHGMLFTVVVRSGTNELALVANSLSLENGHATLTLRDGQQIVGSSTAIERFFYRDECFRFLRPDPAWNSVFAPKKP